MGAWALMLLFAAFWLFKTAHTLSEHHHDHANREACKTLCDHSRAHLHTLHWAKDDCSLCAFVVSVPEPFVLSALPDFLAKLPDSESPVFYRAPVFSKKACDSAMRRGPPATC